MKLFPLHLQHYFRHNHQVISNTLIKLFHETDSIVSSSLFKLFPPLWSSYFHRTFYVTCTTLTHTYHTYVPHTSQFISATPIASFPPDLSLYFQHTYSSPLYAFVYPLLSSSLHYSSPTLTYLLSSPFLY